MKWSCYSSALYNKWCRTNKKARGSHGWLGEERVSVSGPTPAHIHDLPWESPRKFKQTLPREVSLINFYVLNVVAKFSRALFLFLATLKPRKLWKLFYSTQKYNYL